jgi:hypothetical protein
MKLLSIGDERIINKYLNIFKKLYSLSKIDNKAN